MAITGKYTRTISDDGSVGEYYYDGEDKPHRDDGPAVIERKAGGSLVEKFYRHGQLFRPDRPKPVIVAKDETAHSTTESFARGGRICEVNTHFDPPLRLN